MEATKAIYFVTSQGYSVCASLPPRQLRENALLRGVKTARCKLAPAAERVKPLSAIIACLCVLVAGGRYGVALDETANGDSYDCEAPYDCPESCPEVSTRHDALLWKMGKMLAEAFTPAWRARFRAVVSCCAASG